TTRGGHDVTLTEAFTITSGATTITGTKTATDVSQSIYNTCTFPFNGRPLHAVVVWAVPTNYQARIEAPDGSTLRTSGTSRTTTYAYSDPDQNAFAVSLDESFLTAAVPPITKEQCKDDGWSAYGVFKNQGD